MAILKTLADDSRSIVKSLASICHKLVASSPSFFEPVKIWHLETSQILFHLKRAIHMLALPNDQLATYEYDSCEHIHIYDANAGQEVKTLSDSRMTKIDGLTFLSDVNLAVIYSTQGELLLEIQIWDFTSGQMVRTLARGLTSIYSVFSSTSRLQLLNSDILAINLRSLLDGLFSFVVWNWRTGEAKPELRFDDCVSSLFVYLKKSKYLATACCDKKKQDQHVELWSVNC
jgi:hypothetical protein